LTICALEVEQSIRRGDASNVPASVTVNEDADIMGLDIVVQSRIRRERRDMATGKCEAGKK
jgi:hypothetical protein